MSELPKLKKSNFKIALRGENNTKEYKEVSGYIFSWEGENFGVYKDKHGDWIVVEIKTGYKVVPRGGYPDSYTYYSTRKKAIEAAISLMEEIGVDVVKNTINYKLKGWAHAK